MSLQNLSNKFAVRVLLYFIIFLLIPIGSLAIVTVALTQPIPWDRGTFWLRVIVNMLPAFIVLGMAWWLAARFAAEVYALDGIGRGFGFLTRHKFGKLGLSPFMILKHGQVALDLKSILHVGGPGTLIINNDTAVVLEKKGKLTRVEGLGFPSLEPFEKIYAIVDLRPKRWCYPVSAMTKEGIPLTWEVEVQYQIDDGGQQPTDKVPYPFSKEAVFQAATGTWRRERGRLQEMDWEGWVVVGQAEGLLRSLLAQRRLDDLIGLSRADQMAARESIQEELAHELRQVAPSRGVKILEVALDNLRVEDDVTQQWIQNWQTEWQYWSANQLAEEEAERIRAYEIAKGEAQITPLNMLTTELQELNSERDVMSIIMMRLISALDRARLENEIFTPGEALEALRKLQNFLGNGEESRDHDSRHGRENGHTPSPPKNGGTPSDTLRERLLLSPSASDRVATLERLPIVDQITAGPEAPVSDNVVGHMQQTGEFDFEFEGQPFKVKTLAGQSRLKLSQEYDHVVVPVVGDSMELAGIRPGDYVILQKSGYLPIQPASGDIVAVVFRDEDNKATLKRFQIGSDSVRLRPESANRAHRPITLPLEAFEAENPSVTLVGIAKAVLKS